MPATIKNLSSKLETWLIPNPEFAGFELRHPNTLFEFQLNLIRFG